MLWIANQLNSMQSGVHVVFANFISDIETYCQRRANEVSVFCPSRLVFMLNVGISDGEVFIARMERGCHFSIAIYDDNAEEITYGDSLGWKVPGGFLEVYGEVYKYLRTVLEQTDQNLFEDLLEDMMQRLQLSTMTQ